MPKADGRNSVDKTRRPKKVNKVVNWIKKLDYYCYVHEVRTFSWQRSAQFHTSYVAYRWIISLICLAISITTIGDLAKPTGFKRDVIFYLKYFIYLTNLMLTLLTIQTLFGAIIVTKAWMDYEKRNPRFTDIRAKGLEFIYWKLHGLSVDAALVISLGYWLIMDRFRKFPLDGNNILSHAVSTVVAVTDWLITGLPHNLSDAWMGWLWMICYFVFTLLYWLAGGYPRPSPLEKEPKNRAIYTMCTNYVGKTPIVCFMALTGIFSLCHVVLCLVYFIISIFRPKNQAVSR